MTPSAGLPLTQQAYGDSESRPPMPPGSNPGSDPTVPRFLTEASSRALIEQFQAEGVGRARIGLTSRWIANVRWARNRVSLTSEWRDNSVEFGNDVCNQIDAASIRAIGQYEQRKRQAFVDDNDLLPEDFVWTVAPQDYPKTCIWSDRTYAQTPEDRERIAAHLIAGAEQAGLLSAGYLSVEARGNALYTEDRVFHFAPQTLAQCSMTVRDPEGRGSGWAGASSYDWGRFDAAALAATALDKCLKSRNPVKIEPGRYTVIMEPQATFEFANLFLNSGDFSRELNESINGDGLFRAHRVVEHAVGRYGKHVAYDVTKMGEKIIDERLSFTFDPLDPDLGVVPFEPRFGDAFTAVPWVVNGVLTSLFYNREYALEMLQQSVAKPNSRAFRLGTSGPTASVEEMIATTKRGVLVTRFWGVRQLPQHTVCRGMTRDGVWLIEDGKISHPVMNLRFIESPMFVFNNVQQVGVSVPVFSPERPAIVPALKVQDFTFTALVDAI